METAKSPNADGRRQPAAQTGMPRRFGVGTLLGLTTLYAVLFAALRSLRAPPEVLVVVAAYLTAIVLGQMLLFRGRKPREASILVGSAMAIVLSGAAVMSGAPSDAPLPLLLIVTPSFGALIGYLLGGVLGGMLLLAHRWRSRLERRASAGE